jgi:exonuclease VII small subunit
MNISQDISGTIAFYLEELERGEVDAHDCQARLLEAFDRMDVLIVHRESITFRD